MYERYEFADEFPEENKEEIPEIHNTTEFDNMSTNKMLRKLLGWKRYKRERPVGKARRRVSKRLSPASVPCELPLSNTPCVIPLRHTPMGHTPASHLRHSPPVRPTSGNPPRTKQRLPTKKVVLIHMIRRGYITQSSSIAVNRKIIILINRQTTSRK